MMSNQKLNFVGEVMMLGVSETSFSLIQ